MAKITGKYQRTRTHVHELFVNSENVGEELDNWYYQHESEYDILDIKISSCYVGENHAKTVVLIFYRYKQTEE
ncbi:MAG: hypothetical protein II401_04910 [Bacteroidales bacterium]|nr:hypothetical protein [Bacteroidales bacterium]